MMGNLTGQTKMVQGNWIAIMYWLAVMISAILPVMISGCSGVYSPYPPTFSHVAFDLNKGFVSFDTSYSADICEYVVTGWYILPDDQSQKHYAILFSDGKHAHNGGFAIDGYQWESGKEWQPLPPGTEYYLRIEATATNYNSGDSPNNNSISFPNSASATTTEIWRYRDGVFTRISSVSSTDISLLSQRGEQSRSGR